MKSRRRSMHRSIITRVGGFLLLGAAVNVAVAWWCALCTSGRDVMMPYLMSTSDAQTLPCGSMVQLKGKMLDRRYDLFGWEHRGTGFRTLRVQHWAGDYSMLWDTGDYLVERECGWPQMAIEGRCRELSNMDWSVALSPSWDISDSIPWMSKPLALGVAKPKPLGPGLDGWGHRVAPVFLPLKPIWPGFAINTIFYAGVCWLLVAAPFALRRLRGGRRIKRGLCPACAYPVGSSDLCTECGTPKPVPAPSR